MSKNKPKDIAKENPILMVARILLGLVFIFSSLVKGVDPMGTAYRVEDYLAAYNLIWLHGFELSISYFLIGIEFLLGIAMLFKLKPKLASLGVFLIMIFFTIVTFIDAKYDLVPDCGCFGDAIKMTAWETFYKNIVLIVLAAFVFFSRKKLNNSMTPWIQTIILLVFMIGYGWFMSYNFNHLPMVDFRDWKVGNDMKAVGEDENITYLIYQNKETGEQQEYISPNYPWNDSVWKSQWEFVDQRVEILEAPKKHHLMLENARGNDYTKAIIEGEGYTFLLVTPDIETANGEAMLKAHELLLTTGNHSVNFYLISASLPETLVKYHEVYQLKYATFFADDIELKAMIRSNPGLVLLKDGVVVHKWHYNDFPASWREANNDFNQ